MSDYFIRKEFIVWGTGGKLLIKEAKGNPFKSDIKIDIFAQLLRTLERVRAMPAEIARWQSHGMICECMH